MFSVWSFRGEAACDAAVLNVDSGTDVESLGAFALNVVEGRSVAP